MKLTIALCTWNRDQLLRQTLESMVQLTIPEGLRWEILVINNNSTDRTDEVIESFIGQLPIRRIFEANPGLSNARNAATHHAGGEYILWIDDDVKVDKEWLAEYCKAFQKWPEAVFFGGPIIPFYEAGTPAWLQHLPLKVRELCFVERSIPAGSLQITRDALPFGANFAIRSQEQRQFLYDARLGHCPQGLMGGEETKVLEVLLGHKMSGYWIPAAIVHHYIPKERANFQFIRKRYFDYGRAEDPLEIDGSKNYFGIPRWILKQAIISECIYRSQRMFSSPDVWIKNCIKASTAGGLWFGLSKNQFFKQCIKGIFTS